MPQVVCLLFANVFYLCVKDVYVHHNMHVLNYLSSGTVHIHPRCHTGGLSVWRNSYSSLRVQSCFLWADPHRLADQLVTSEGRVPGKPDCDQCFQSLWVSHFTICLLEMNSFFSPSKRKAGWSGFSRHLCSIILFSCYLANNKSFSERNLDFRRLSVIQVRVI